MLGITPQTAYGTSAFYDKNNNALNIPCEGPKVCPIIVDLSVDTDYTVDFSQLFISGKMTAIQSVILTLHSTTGYVNLVSDINYPLRVRDATSGVYPFVCGASPKVLINQPNVTPNGILRVSFANYKIPFFTGESGV